MWLCAGAGLCPLVRLWALTASSQRLKASRKLVKGLFEPLSLSLPPSGTVLAYRTECSSSTEGYPDIFASRRALSLKQILEQKPGQSLLHFRDSEALQGKGG